METVNLNLAHRWYIGYDLDESVPDPSSLSRIRERYGLETFQLFFEHVVELCIEAGLVWGIDKITIGFYRKFFNRLNPRRNGPEETREVIGFLCTFARALWRTPNRNFLFKCPRWSF